MLRIAKAHIRFVPEDEGGIQDGFDGMRPSFNLTGEPLLCVVRSLGRLGQMPRGDSHDVEIELPYGESTEIAKHLRRGAGFTLQVGAGIIAIGIIVGLAP